MSNKETSLKNRLSALTMNAWWSWDLKAHAFLKEIDLDLWKKHYNNPTRIIQNVTESHWKELSEDTDFLRDLEEMEARFQNYMSDETWYKKEINENKTIAYFSAEFGIHESLTIYCGGLGILAGDHLKSSSDLGVPLIGIGLMYNQGYFTQAIDKKGWQQESYDTKVMSDYPFQLQKDSAGKTIILSIPVADREVKAQIWKLQVGRVPLYLLDTNLKENTPADRQITDHLYGGDTHMRIQQELILGVGGMKALSALGITPDVFHMNEGHSAFLILERLINLVDSGETLEAARATVQSSSVFTTHTPVPAGNDWFDPAILKGYLAFYLKKLDLTFDEFVKYGRTDTEDEKQFFCMTVLALHFSRFANGVSQLHGEVAREMWQDLWPKKKLKDVPIGAITNGIHLGTWTSDQFRNLYEEKLGIDIDQMIDEKEFVSKVDSLADEEIWKLHMKLKAKLRKFVLTQKELPLEDKDLLNPEVLTIGFARRFATYKRADLLLSDLKRVEKIVNDTKRPVQFLFAGKAHPKDEPGKQLIQKIVEAEKMPEFKGKIFFIENYNMDVARYLVQGVDLWLNNPSKPLEASGTSGMKLIANGGLNFSILDGWWAEGYQKGNGWKIESFEKLDDATRAVKEADSLYHVLEKEIIPTFYDQTNGLPTKWVAMIKKAMKELIPFFNTHRMVKEYLERAYFQLEKV